jgi:hypothetical protein
LTSGTIHDDANTGHDPTMRAHNVDGFLDAAASGDDVFGHDEPFVRPNLEPPPQDQAARVLFREDVAFAERSSDLLANDDPAKGRGDYGVAFNPPQFVSKPSADIGSDVRVLKEKRALKKLPAPQARAEDEMAVEQRPRSSKEREQVLAH